MMAVSPETRYRIGARKLNIDPSEYRRHSEAGTRWCFRHQTWLPLASFGPHRRMPSGFDTQCRECNRAFAREYMRRKRGYYDRHPVNRPS